MIKEGLSKSLATVHNRIASLILQMRVILKPYFVNFDFDKNHRCFDHNSWTNEFSQSIANRFLSQSYLPGLNRITSLVFRVQNEATTVNSFTDAKTTTVIVQRQYCRFNYRMTVLSKYLLKYGLLVIELVSILMLGFNNTGNIHTRRRRRSLDKNNLTSGSPLFHVTVGQKFFK